MTRYTVAGFLAALAAVLALAVPAAATPTAPGGTDPPNCRLIPAVLQNSTGGQSTAWFHWCYGGGPDGTVPVKSWVTQFTGDGFTFDASQCPKANPCTIYGSPAAPATTRAVTVQAFTATTSGTPITSPTNGILYIYDNVTAQHHTRTVEYYDSDGYHKTAVLTSSSRPMGVILASETIDNGCGGPTQDQGSVNPVGGDGGQCSPVLHATQPALYPLHGDLAGRYCRVPPPGFTGTCPFNVARTETATGTGPYLTVGDKDHGALTRVDYLTYVGSEAYSVQVTLPAATPALVTRIVLLPTTAPAPYAVLVFT